MQEAQRLEVRRAFLRYFFRRLKRICRRSSSGRYEACIVPLEAIIMMGARWYMVVVRY